MRGERIVGVAIIWKEDGKTYSLPEPNRHHHIIKMLWTEKAKKKFPIVGEQGFVTNEGRFVSRRVAAIIACKSGQIAELKSELYSEDLW